MKGLFDFENLVWFVRGCAEGLGWAMIGAVVVAFPVFMLAPSGRTPVGAVAVSPVATQLAAQFAPGLQKLAKQHQEDIVNLADGTIQRFAARQVFPVGVKSIPLATEVGLDAALDYLDTLKASEVAGLLVDHANAKGTTAHWSLRAAAEGAK